MHGAVPIYSLLVCGFIGPLAIEFVLAPAIGKICIGLLNPVLLQILMNAKNTKHMSCTMGIILSMIVLLTKFVSLTKRF